MCFDSGGAKWKREQIVDHKFDFIDVNDFTDNSFLSQFKYLFVFLVIIKSVLVYTADLWTAGLLLSNKGWSSDIAKPRVDLTVSRWVFVASIAASFILLAWEWRKTYRVVKSRDIAYSYTLPGAYRFYAARSYPHFCLFQQIGQTQGVKDGIAFFCFFVLKGWKRFLFAEAPRQSINALTLAGVYFPNGKFKPTNFYSASDDWTERLTVALMTFSFVVWVLTTLRLVMAFLAYIPLLMSIRGNLKEYVCHKIDKRIAFLLRAKSKKRIMQEQAERKRLERELAASGTPLAGAAAAGFAAPNIIKNQAGKPVVVQQPTLPDIGRFADPESIPMAQGPYAGNTGAPTVISVGGGGVHQAATPMSEVSAYPTSAFSGGQTSAYNAYAQQPLYHGVAAVNQQPGAYHGYPQQTSMVSGLQPVIIEAAPQYEYYPSSDSNAYTQPPPHPSMGFEQYGYAPAYNASQVYRPNTHGYTDPNRPLPPPPASMGYQPAYPPGSNVYRDSGGTEGANTVVTGHTDLVEAVPAVLNPSSSNPMAVPGQGHVPLVPSTGNSLRSKVSSSTGQGTDPMTGEERYNRTRARANAQGTRPSLNSATHSSSAGPGPPPASVNF